MKPACTLLDLPACGGARLWGRTPHFRAVAAASVPLVAWYPIRQRELLRAGGRPHGPADAYVALAAVHPLRRLSTS